MASRIVFATASLTINKASGEGCPLMVRDGLIEIVPSNWFTTLWPRSHDTARTYARGLLRWWQFLDNQRLLWWDVLPEDVRLYSATLTLAGVGHRSKTLMFSGVDAFYRWALEEGHILRHVLLTPSLKAGGGMPRRNPLPVLERVPRKHTRAAFDAIQAALPRQSSGLNVRDEIIGEFGYYTGLRRMEVAGLRVASFAGFPSDEPRAITIVAETTKNKRSHDVVVPPVLLRRIACYLEVYRPQVVERALQLDARYEEPETLLLTRTGTPVRREYISALWAAKAKAAGKPTRYHMNRHTMLSAVIRASDRAGDDRLRVAQDIAGHASDSTTALYDQNSGFEDGDPFERALLEAHDILGG